MRSRAAAAFLLACALACGRPAPPPPPKAAQPAPQAEEDSFIGAPEVDNDVDNLLNLAYGASVISRTGEANLEASALHAIDGLSSTGWTAPSGAGPQTLVFSMATLSRVDHLGITSSGETSPKKVRFDASSDGEHWREVLTQENTTSSKPQIVDVKPFEARYIRVETIEPRGFYQTLSSVHAIGKELQAPARRTFDGCWTINGLPARFVQNGARVTGVIATNPPTYLDGGSDGRVARMVWLRSPNRGYATFSMDPSTGALSGLRFYEDISIKYVADAWFGTPCAKNVTIGPAPGLDEKGLVELIDRAGRWSIYGLAFDDREQLIEEANRSTLDSLASFLRARPAQHFRIVAHELHMDEPQPRTAARVAALRASLQKRGVNVSRIELVAAGPTWSDPPITFAIQRLMASRIDLEKAETQAKR